MLKKIVVCIPWTLIVVFKLLDLITTAHGLPTDLGNFLTDFQGVAMTLSNFEIILLVLGTISVGYVVFPELVKFFREDRAKELSTAESDRSITNNAPNYGSQIIGDVTFNVSNGYALLDENEVRHLASKLSGLSSIDVQVVGSDKCFSIGSAIVERLKSLGVTVRDTTWIGQQIPEPLEPYAVVFSKDKSTATLTIAPKAY